MEPDAKSSPLREGGSLNHLVRVETTTSHALHISLVILSCGLWLFVYIPLLVIRASQKPTQTQVSVAIQKDTQGLQEKIDRDLEALKSVTGGAAVIAYRNLQTSINKYFEYQMKYESKITGTPMNHKEPLLKTETKLKELVASIGFDPTTLLSTQIGIIKCSYWDSVEVFQEFIVYGQVFYNVDESTRGEVHTDGSVQLDSEGKKRDFRTAEVQFISKEWSFSAPLIFDSVSEARRITAQLLLVTESMKPSNATSADIASMVQAILSNTGQSQADRIEQLSALRYQHLLSDEEFQTAKTKILGI
jgi:hypothetical protein